MRAHRTKFDCSRPFKVINSRPAFEALTPTDHLFPPADQNHHSGPMPKEEIVVPRIEIVPRITQPKKNAEITPNYIRIPAALNLPHPQSYQLTQVDWLFVAGLKDRFAAYRQRLDGQFLERVIVQLQGRAGRDNVLPRSKGWVVDFIDKNYKSLIDLPNFQEFASDLFNYWKSRREELKFPLWRPLWRPADNDGYNHMLAFKSREKRSRNLRRTNRFDDTELILELHEEYRNASLLCQRIQLRQELKLKSIHLQLAAFAQECKPLLDVSLPEVPPSQELKERVRAARISTQQFKRRRQFEETQQQAPPKESPNIRQSVACFLANAVYEAEKQGIGYDSIFPQAQTGQTALKAAIQQTNRMIQELPEQQEETIRHQGTAFSMRRYGNMLVRSLSQDQEQCDPYPQDFLTLKRKQVARSYFGDDDQLGDTRDLRKTISSNFRRFLQLGPSGQERRNDQ